MRIVFTQRYIFWKVVWNPTWHWKEMNINRICIKCRPKIVRYFLGEQEGHKKITLDHRGGRSRRAKKGSHNYLMIHWSRFCCCLQTSCHKGLKYQNRYQSISFVACLRNFKWLKVTRLPNITPNLSKINYITLVAFCESRFQLASSS